MQQQNFPRISNILIAAGVARKPYNGATAVAMEGAEGGVSIHSGGASFRCFLPNRVLESLMISVWSHAPGG